MTSAKIRYANLICPYIKTPNEKSCKIDSRTMLSWVKLERDLASRFSNLVSVYLLLFSQYHKAIHLLSQSHLLRSSKPLTVKIVNVSWCSPIFSFKGKITNNARASRFCLKRSTFIFAQFEDQNYQRFYLRYETVPLFKFWAIICIDEEAQAFCSKEKTKIIFVWLSSSTK